jgi:lysophospholipase L1-like esterase
VSRYGLGSDLDNYSTFVYVIQIKVTTMSAFSIRYLLTLLLAYTIFSNFTLAQDDQNSLTIVAFGNSTTAPRRTIDSVYSDRLPDLLAGSGITCRVINSGVGGSHTGRLTDNNKHKWAHGLDRFQTAVLDHDPDIVIIQFGINDSYIDGGGQQGESRIPLDKYKENLRYMVQKLHESESIVLLMTPNAFGSNKEYWRHVRLAEYAQACRDLANEELVELIDIYKAFESYGNGSLELRDELLLDGVHPNDAGHKISSELIANRIRINEAQPPIYLGEPSSNEGTTLVNDYEGNSVFVFRKGDWDHGGFTDTVFYKMTSDEGRSWTESKSLVITPGNPAQCFSTISPVTGEFLVFYSDRGNSFMLARSSNQWKDWTFQEMHTPDDTPINTISYGNAIWVDNGEKKRVICGFHGGSLGCGTFYSDDEGQSWQVSDRINVPNTIPNIWQTGAVEPTMVQLRDGSILMYIRNSNFNIYQSTSTDLGASWSEPIKTDLYCGDNSWVTLKKLKDERIVLIWNNAKALRPEVTLDKWNFTGREVLHIAISEDDGISWTGFRELALDPLRNGGFINHPGDKGLNESKIVETREGNLLVAVGQAPKHRSFLLVDPDWIYQKSRDEDFSQGLENWSRQKIMIRPAVYKRLYHHNYERKEGAILVRHPQYPDRNVLHIRRPADTTVFSQRDGAVWNFPAGINGQIEIDLLLNEGFKGSHIALNDRWFQPIDNQGRETAMYVLDIPASGQITPTFKMEKGRWYTMTLNWVQVDDPSQSVCKVMIDDQFIEELSGRNNSLRGISYVRFRSQSRSTDDAGMYVSGVKVRVESKHVLE